MCNVKKCRVFHHHLLPSCRSTSVEQVVPVVVSYWAVLFVNYDLTEKRELARRRPPNLLPGHKTCSRVAGIILLMILLNICSFII